MFTRTMSFVIVSLVLMLATACTGGISPGPQPVEYYSVSGLVLDSTGEGVSGVTVTAVYNEGTATEVTNADGFYEFLGLQGIVDILGPEIEDQKTIPTFKKVTEDSDDVNFVIHTIQTLEEEILVADNNVIVYEEVVLDFSSSSLSLDTTVKVSETTQAPSDYMTSAGPVVQIELSSEFSGTAVLQLATNDSENSGLFRYDEIHDAWNPVVGASYADGYIYAELTNFSIYGVFSAPRADVPTTQPAPGSYHPGTAIQLLGDIIYFTTDGSEPNRDSEIYDGLNRPILGQDNLVINAFNVTANRRPSETVQLHYTTDGAEEISYISGPIFVTLSGTHTRFDFDAGEVTTDISAADVTLTAAQIGGEYTAIALRGFEGTWFRPDSNEVWENQEAAYEYYRAVGISDWQDDDPFDMGRLEKNDTLLIRTSEGRFVKVFIIDIRGHWQHDDAPAVDFVYQFTDEIDIEPPVLEQVTVITVDGQEVSQPVSNIIEFELPSEPKFLILDFNEIVYRNRGLMQEQEDSPFSESIRRSVWWSYASPLYYLRPSLSDQFRGRLWGITPEFGTIILTEGDDYSKYENDFFTDQGFYFSDLKGNRWTELPFEKITISFETDDD